MADTPLKLSNWDLADIAAPGLGSGNTLDTGVLRRKYNFGDRVSELAIAQTPFFRFLSKVAKNPTDDPSFKFVERRPSFHKRYGYVVGIHSAVAASNNTVGDATLGAHTYLFMAGDYKSGGNIQNVQGQATGKIDVGATGTSPEYYLPKQILKVPMSSPLVSFVLQYCCTSRVCHTEFSTPNLSLPITCGEWLVVPCSVN